MVMNVALLILIFQKLLLVITFLVYLFWTWRLGRIWGFQKEKILDLALITPAAGLVVYSISEIFGLKSESFFLLGGLAFVVYFTEKQIWSSHKIGDVFALSLSVAAVFYPYYPNPIFNLLSLLTFYFLSRVSKAKPRSGFVFFTFLILVSFYFGFFSFWKYHSFFNINYVFSIASLVLGVISLRKRNYAEAMDLLKYSLPRGILENLKNRLLEKKKDLKSEAGNPASGSKTLNLDSEKSVEDRDRALEEQEKERNESVLNLIDQSQKEVDTALKKMERGTYGICEKCHKPIDKARLEVYPESRFCLDHAGEE